MAFIPICEVAIDCRVLIAASNRSSSGRVAVGVTCWAVHLDTLIDHTLPFNTAGKDRAHYFSSASIDE
jgi:hypothetical protein